MSFSNLFKGFTDLFSVDSSVSSSSFDMSDDVLKTQNALADLGHFNAQTPNIGEGLKSFQSEQGLKVDGIMNPGGPTENALSQTLASQGISNTDVLAKSDTSLPDNVTVTKPVSSKPDTKSWSASASFGDKPKPKAPPKPKLDPMTGLPDPLAQAPKGKMPTAKQWEEVAKLQKQKTQTAIIPSGDTVQQRIQSMMQDNRYQDKNDTGLRDHVVKQFEKAYPGKLQYDETGKMIQPKAVIRPEDVEPYDPHGELKVQERSYDQGQTNYVQGVSNELSERDQTASASTHQAGRVDYPQGASVRTASAQSSDQLGAGIPLDADAITQAQGDDLDTPKQDGSYQVVEVAQKGVMNDASQALKQNREAYPSIDKDFIGMQEGSRNDIYFPKRSGDKLFNKSGATIGKGVDLGQMNERDLQNLVDNYGLKQETADKLKPYLGLKGQKAIDNIKALTKANGEPLTLSKEELNVLNTAKYTQVFKTLETFYNSASKTKFQDLPAEAQTAIASVALQYGPAMKNAGKAPKFWSYIIKQDWNKAIAELEDFEDEHPSRRKREAALLRGMLKSSAN